MKTSTQAAQQTRRLPVRFRLRPVRQEDLDQVEALERELCPDPWPRGAFETQMRNPYTEMWVAVVEGNEGGKERVIGYLVLWIHEDAVEVANIGVAQAYQGRKVGSALLEKALDTARRLGKTYVYLDVRMDNHKALQWYLRRGFQIERRLPRYYRIPPNRWEDGLRMVKKIAP